MNTKIKVTNNYVKCNSCGAMIYSPTRSSTPCRCGGKFKRVNIKELNMRATVLRNEISKLSFEIGDMTDELMDIRTTISIADRRRQRSDEGIEINGSGPSRDKKRWWSNITLWSTGSKRPRAKREMQ